MEDSEILEKRVNKIFKWIKNPYNLAFVSILVFAIVIRLYYFILTKNQPLWWDEADYMDLARYWAGLSPQVSVIIEPVRQVLNPFLMSLVFRIAGVNEFIPRVFMLILSIASVVGMYSLGKELYSRRVGLLSSFFMSFFWLNLFFTYRILVDMHSLAFFTISAFLFYKYFKTGSCPSLYWASALIAIGTLFKLSTAFLLPAILIYALITEKLSIFKKKEIWIAAGIFLLILSPYLLWGYSEFGGFILTKSAGEVAPENYSVQANNLIAYLKLFPTYLSLIVLIIFILGLISMYKLFVGFDILIKNKDETLERDLYLLLILIIPLVLVSIMLNHSEDRYILFIFPAVFIIASAFIFAVFDFIKKKGKFLAILFIILVLIFAMNSQIRHADSLIKNKKDSYLQVKEAGLWIKENSKETDVIMSSSYLQIKFYADRETISVNSLTEEEMDKLRNSTNKPKYYMVSIFEHQEPWTLSYAQKNNLTLVQAYFIESAGQKQPVLLIYEL
ncbi:MAG: glycosyltransferase family 39 protein [Nanoarchaeota archaeon]|nr:glycosyltransferase family 39 protein [Nanoarchaeota archaeon]